MLTLPSHYRTTLRKLMFDYPSSFVGFFDIAADVLEELGLEWNPSNPNYGSVFLECATTVRKVSDRLAILKEEFDNANTVQQ